MEASKILVEIADFIVRDEFFLKLDEALSGQQLWL